MAEHSLPVFLDMMDSQRVAAFAALEGLSDSRLWQRPVPKEWSIGEILDHNMRLYNPIFGWCNLIVTLRIGIYHDQLHYDDAFKQARAMQGTE
jgi:hypothetical protein